MRPGYFEHVFAVNVKAPFYILQQALSRLRDGARVVNISPVAARIAYPESAAAGSERAMQAAVIAVSAPVFPWVFLTRYWTRAFAC